MILRFSLALLLVGCPRSFVGGDGGVVPDAAVPPRDAGPPASDDTSPRSGVVFVSGLP